MSENNLLVGIHSNISKISTATIGGGLVALGAIAYTTKKIRQYQGNSRLQKIISTRTAKRNEQLKQLKQKYVLDDEAKAIVELSFEDLTKKLQDRSLTAVDAYKAYMAKAINVTVKFNCITEFVPRALEMAEELDKLHTVKGPFHGVPICLKDDHDVQGMNSTLGLGKYLNKPAKKNACLVQSLIDLGAVPFCKTNVPQTLFSYGSDNPIYGATKNHINTKLGPGGSSSGSGCLIGAGGSIFGTGSDIGGSVRIPSHFSGICGIRPTLNRLSGNGVIQCLPKCVGFKGVPGIMAQDSSTVASVFRSLTLGGLQNKYDPQAMRVPWDDQVFKSDKPLRIGYYSSLPFYPAIGDTMETVLNAKNALESRGHTLVPFSLGDDWRIMKLINELLSVDYGKPSFLNDVLENEPHVGVLQDLRFICALPTWRRRILYYLSTLWFLPSYSKRISFVSQCGLNNTSAKQVWELMHQRSQLISEILDNMEKAGVDLLLTPAFPFPACRMEASRELFLGIHYTMVWNLVDFPAGVVTYGNESGKNIDAYNDEGDSLLRLTKKNAKESVGSPIAVQLIAKPYQEELVLRAMVELASTKK